MFLTKETSINLSDQIWLDLFSQYIPYWKWIETMDMKNLTDKWNNFETDNWNDFQSKEHQWGKKIFEYVDNLNPEKILTIEILKRPEEVM